MGIAECHQEVFLFSIIMVSSFPIYSEVLGQVSSLRYLFHLIERALNPIKIMVFIHSHKFVPLLYQYVLKKGHCCMSQELQQGVIIIWIFTILLLQHPVPWPTICSGDVSRSDLWSMTYVKLFSNRTLPSYCEEKPVIFVGSHGDCFVSDSTRHNAYPVLKADFMAEYVQLGHCLHIIG